jgi:type IV fimbrial biogenesis protein FimT
MMRRWRGFTLIELMTVVAVVAVLLTLAAPWFYDLILVQRLKGINAQLVTDLQFARSEAASRNMDVYVHVKTQSDDPSVSCYTIYAIRNGDWELKCDCTQTPGSSCADPQTVEVRTVQVPASTGVRLTLPADQPPSFGFIPSTGALRIDHILAAARLDEVSVSASIDGDRTLTVTVGRSGRPTVCSAGTPVTGYSAC